MIPGIAVMVFVSLALIVAAVALRPPRYVPWPAYRSLHRDPVLVAVSSARFDARKARQDAGHDRAAADKAVRERDAVRAANAELRRALDRALERLAVYEGDETGGTAAVAALPTR